jgi:c-di-GMP-binding flagellar brake protein YcgR
VSGDVRSERPVAVSVRLIDIGLSGVLMASSLPFQVGQFARLSARLGERAIETDVEIRRVSSRRDEKGGYAIGARFVSLDEGTRRVLQQFLAAGDR